MFWPRNPVSPRCARGGNALDAAIAAAATIAVVYPHMNGVGGDNVWLIHDAGAGRLTALCGIGRSARAASIEWYAARGMAEAIPIRGGPAALTVPGAVDGWWQAHQYSTRSMGSALPWKTLFGDAIAYARGGFSASAGQARGAAGRTRPLRTHGHCPDQGASLAALPSRRARPGPARPA